MSTEKIEQVFLWKTIDEIVETFSLTQVRKYARTLNLYEESTDNLLDVRLLVEKIHLRSSAPKEEYFSFENITTHPFFHSSHDEKVDLVNRVDRVDFVDFAEMLCDFLRCLESNGDEELAVSIRRRMIIKASTSTDDEIHLWISIYNFSADLRKKIKSESCIDPFKIIDVYRYDCQLTFIEYTRFVTTFLISTCLVKLKLLSSSTSTSTSTSFRACVNMEELHTAISIKSEESDYFDNVLKSIIYPLFIYAECAESHVFEALIHAMHSFQMPIVDKIKFVESAMATISSVLQSAHLATGDLFLIVKDKVYKVSKDEYITMMKKLSTPCN
jgi:hypothetical protein